MDVAMGRVDSREFECSGVIGIVRPIDGRRPSEVDGRHGMSLAVADKDRVVMRLADWVRFWEPMRGSRAMENMMQVVVVVVVVVVMGVKSDASLDARRVVMSRRIVVCR